MANNWFDEEHEKDIVAKLVSKVSEIEKSQEEQRRREWARFDLELYTGEKIDDLDDAVNVFHDRRPGDADNSQIFNVTYSVLSTIESRIASFRPRAQFLPNGADGKAKKAARNMTDLSDAWADSVDYQAEAVECLNDLLTGDAGVMKVYEEDDTIKLARFPAWEFMVDPADGKYGMPECIYHVRRIEATQAASMLGLDEHEIAQSGTWDALQERAISGTNRVRLIEGWRRSPGNDENGDPLPGKHIIVVGDHWMEGGKNVEIEDWNYDGFPLVIERYRKCKTGFWGRSAISLHRAAQIELNEMQITAREAHRMSATKIIHVPQEEQAPTKINNDYVVIDRYKARPMSVDTPPAWNPENYQYIKIIRDQVYETHGISQYQAVATHRPGVDSGRALEEDSEQQADRLAILSQKWERMRTETAKWWWRLTRDLAKKMEAEGKESKPKWKVITRGVWKEMVFEDVDSEYQITVFPSSLFGHSVAGRFKKAEALIEKQWITREDALANLDVPDLMPTVDLILAEQYEMERIVDAIMSDGKLEKPDPLIPAEKMFNYARNRYLLAMAQGSATEAQLDMMRRLINSVAPKPPAEPASPPAGAAPGVPPMGAPPAPVIAPGIPNAPITQPSMQLPAPSPGVGPAGEPPPAVPLGPSILPMVQ